MLVAGSDTGLHSISHGIHLMQHSGHPASRLGVMWGRSTLTSLWLFWYHLVAPAKGDGGLHANMKCSNLKHLPAPPMLWMQRSAHALMALQITHPKSSAS